MLLAELGARVIKVESVDRPDGARRGPAAFFDLLNAEKESLALDFAHPGDTPAAVAAALIANSSATPASRLHSSTRCGRLTFSRPFREAAMVATMASASGKHSTESRKPANTATKPIACHAPR